MTRTADLLLQHGQPETDSDFEDVFGDQVSEASSDKLKDRWFDTCLYARGDAVRALVDGMAGGHGFHEEVTAPRIRARREVDQRTHDAAVECVLCNLALAILDPPETGRIAVPLGKGTKKTRYQNDDVKVPAVRSVLDDLERIHLNPAHIQRQQRSWRIPAT